jgi:very-short-patch-repair endonuclease
MTYSKVVELANERLHSTRSKFMDGLTTFQLDSSTFVINLDASAAWINDGMDAHSMLESLLASPKAKRAADGCVLNPRNKILTSFGWKKIKDIVIGDMVLTHSGKFREVKELLISKAGLGTEYVCIKPNSEGNFNGKVSRKSSEITSPSLSLTLDHLVLTPNGWVEAGKLKKGDLIATPADLTRLCGTCNAPLPINAIEAKYCLNNRCARLATYKEGRGLATLTLQERSINGALGAAAAKRSGCHDAPDWGARDPKQLKKMRDKSVESMRARNRDGRWAPEIFFEERLRENNIRFVREYPIKTDRVFYNRGKPYNSTLYCDFYLPDFNAIIELDGTRWHSTPEAKERDLAKDIAVAKLGLKMLRVPSHEIFKRGETLARSISTWGKNHSGQLGIGWVKIRKIVKGVVNRKDHVYSKKYDICLDAEEHSFVCETVIIHNSKYIVVPFQHNKAKQNQTPAQQSLLATIKKELNKIGETPNRLELDRSGQPKQGLVRSMDIMNNPISGKKGISIGSGPRGHVAQGPSGIPLLQGIRIYQKEMKDKSGETRMGRFVMTFRVASSKHKGKWNHPGVPARNIMEDGLKWALERWESKIAPGILDKVIAKIG